MERICRACKFWGNSKGALSFLFHSVWSAQMAAREDPKKDTQDYDALYKKYPYGYCACSEFVDASNDVYEVDASENASGIYKCSQKGVFIRDGEGCGASFVTRETFGCVFWREKCARNSIG